MEFLKFKKQRKAANLLFFNILDNKEHNNNLQTVMKNIIEKINKDIDSCDILQTYRLDTKTGRKTENLAISDDLTQEERDQRRALLQFFPYLRKRGYISKIKNSKIMIEGTSFSPEEIAWLIESNSVSEEDSNPENQTIRPSRSTLPQYNTDKLSLQKAVVLKPGFRFKHYKNSGFPWNQKKKKGDLDKQKSVKITQYTGQHKNIDDINRVSHESQDT